MSLEGVLLIFGITWGSFFIVGGAAYLIARHLNKKINKQLENEYNRLVKECQNAEE